MKKLLNTILLALLCLPALAQSWNWQQDISNYDPARWLSETVLHATIVADGVPQNNMLLAAFVDGELRGYADGCYKPAERPDMQVYTVRVKGDEADRGRAIDFRVVDKTEGSVYFSDMFTLSRAIEWTGETEGMPSQPIVITLSGFVPVTGITAIGGKTLVRQDHDAEHPYDLTYCFWMTPGEATNTNVQMEVLDATQGSVVEHDGRWGFIPSATCKGQVQIRITSVSNPEVSAVLTLTVKVRVEEIRVNNSLRTTLALGETIDFSPYFTVLPADADNRRVAFSYDNKKLEISQNDGDNYELKAIDLGETGVTIAAEENRDVWAELKFTVESIVTGVRCRMEACEDDVTDEAGGIVTKRQAMWTPRSFVFTPVPATAQLLADRLTWTAQTSQTLPGGWTVGDVTMEEITLDDNQSAVRLTYTPRVPGTHSISFQYDDMPVTDDKGNVLTAVLPVCTKTTLRLGWNWIGAQVSQHGTPLSQSLSNKDWLLEARTQNHFLVNDPELGYTFGFKDANGNYTNDFTLDRAIDNGHFRIKMANNHDNRLFTDGDFVFDDSEWTLRKGWTWVSNPSLYPLDIALLNGNPAFTDGDVMKTRTQMSTYTGGKWVGTIATLAAGQALAIKTAKAGRVTFSIDDMPQLSPYANAQQAPNSGAQQAPANHDQPCLYDPSRFMDNMGIIAALDPEDPSDPNALKASKDLSDLSAYSLLAFVDDECRGEGKLVDGRWFIVVHGEGGEMVMLRLLDLTTGEETPLAGQYAFAPLLGSYESPLRVALHAQDEPPATTYNLQGIRQPSTSHLPSGIYIRNGKKLIVR